MESVELINDALIQLWKDQEDRAPQYVPMFYQKPPESPLVFVGLNPSFSVKGWRSILDKADNELIKKVNPEQFFGWENNKGFDFVLAHELEKLAQNGYAFFSPHRELSKIIGCEESWVHYDLFACRETDQKSVQNQLLVLKKGDYELTDFGNKQFELFECLLALSKPKAIIIVNALASRIYLKNHKNQISFDSDKGHYFVTLNGIKVPIFFSGMLTGARALDTFSRERLYWQVANALNKEWSPSSHANEF